MQTNILWSGIEYHSLENCIIDSNVDVIVNSIIIGSYNEKIYRVEYLIKLNELWETHYCFVKSQIDSEIKNIEFGKNQNMWSLNGKYFDSFDDCTDVDIPLTPLTNSLSINRLKLNQGQEREIDVIYIDLLEDSIEHVKQKYRRISSEVYKYENIPNDFETEIKVDDAGFVIDYPQLFTRTSRKEVHFKSIIIFFMGFLLFSCDKNHVDDPPFSISELASCYRDSVWNESKISNELIGTWHWEYVSCFWSPDQAKNVIDSNLTIEFRADSTLLMKRSGKLLQTSTWEVVEGDLDLFSIEEEPFIDLLFGRMLICDDKLIFNGSYIDFCDNYFRREN